MLDAPAQRLSVPRDHPRRAAPHPRVTLLGRFAVTDFPAESETALPSSGRRVVALAALHPRIKARSEIIAALWPHLAGKRASANLRSALSRLRSSTPHLLSCDLQTVHLAPGVSVDAWEMEQLAAGVARGAVPDSAFDDVPVEALTAELLPGWDDEWVILERDRLRELRLHVLEQLAARFVERSNLVRAIQLLYEILRVDPLRESAMRTLIELHLGEGNQAQAVREFLSFRERLHTELQLPPSQAMTGLMAGLVPRFARTDL